MTEINFERLNKDFDIFSEEINSRLDELIKSGNPIVELDYEGSLFDIYLNNIPEEYNPVFRVNRFFDGSADRHFINRIGNLAMITPNYKLVHLWDFESETFFENSRKEMLKVLKKCKIKNAFLTSFDMVGSGPNKDSKDPRITWTHYKYKTPSEIRCSKHDIGDKLGKLNTQYNVFKRTMKECRLEDLESVIELGKDKSIYRASEFLGSLEKWHELKTKYNKKPSDEFLWYNVIKDGAYICYRNTVIGSLIDDLYNGVDLEKAVKSYESKVAPSNYKRPKALVTARMVEDARAKLEEVGLLESIYRKAAKFTEIPTDKILFTSQESKSLSVFDDLKQDAELTVKKKLDLSKAKEIKFGDFIKLLPKVSKIGLLPNSAVNSSKVVLTNSKNENIPTPFKWDNNFAWSYIESDTADSIVKRVKEAGGVVDGDVRFSLSWDNSDDLDLSFENNYYQKIYFGDKRTLGGRLDVDANFSEIVENPVENIYWSNINHLKDGEYKVSVNNYMLRSERNQGFKLQMEVLGEITTYSYPDNDLRSVTTMLKITKKGNDIEVTYEDPKLIKSNVSGNKFIDIKNVIKSPNAWNGETIGNEHIIFLADDVEVKFSVRGFYNEQLNSKLEEHRKVTEILGSKLKIDPVEFESTDTVKGYGISTTSNNVFYLRLTYNDNRQELIKLTK